VTSPNVFLSRRSVSVVLFAAIVLIIHSCNANDRSQNEYVSLEERQGDFSKAKLEYNAARLVAELQIIDSLSVAWGWNTEVISGGIVYEKVEASHEHVSSVSAVPVIEGETVLWNVSASLINGVTCFVMDSLQFVVGSASQPSGFEAIASHTLRGDSVRAIVPSLLGYGNKGLPGQIPPGALLVLHLRQF
jgi:hypothetical protein